MESKTSEWENSSNTVGESKDAGEKCGIITVCILVISFLAVVLCYLLIRFRQVKEYEV